MIEYQLLIIIVYRIFILFVGFGFAYLGYKLFCKGVLDPASNFKGNWKEANISITQAAPGTLFALFGVVLAIFGAYREFSVNLSNDYIDNKSLSSISKSINIRFYEDSNLPRTFTSLGRKAELSNDTISKSNNVLKLALKVEYLKNRMNSNEIDKILGNSFLTFEQTEKQINDIYKGKE